MTRNIRSVAYIYIYATDRIFSPILRLENTWQEIRDHSFIQNHSRSFRFPAPWRCFFSSVHPHSCSTGFRSEDWNGHSRSLVLCSVTHFCVVFEVCVWIIAHYKISNSQSLIDFYLLVFDRIRDAMCLNKISRTSSRNIGTQHQKYSSIFHCTHGVLLSLCSPNPSWVFAAKKLNYLFHMTIEASPIWSSSRVQCSL